MPSAESILDKYIQAVGGAQRLAGLTSFVGKGTSVGFGGFGGGGDVEIVAKAPDKRATIIMFKEETGRGDQVRAYNGRRRLGENTAQRAGRVSVDRDAIWTGPESTRNCRFQARSSRFSRI